MSSGNDRDAQGAPVKGQRHPYLKDYIIVEGIPYLSRALDTDPTIWLQFVGDSQKHTILLFMPEGPFQISTPKWEEWIQKPLWQVQDAARLVFGLAPDGLTTPPGVPRRTEGLYGPAWPPEARELELLARAAIDAGQLPKVPGGVHVQDQDGAYFLPSNVERDRRPGETWERVWLVRPADFIQWAASRGYAVPDPLRVFLEGRAQEQPRPEAPAQKAPQADEGSHAPASEQRMVPQSNAAPTVAVLLDGNSKDWRPITQEELDALKRDEGIGLLVIDLDVHRAPGGTKIRLQPYEEQLLVGYVQHAGEHIRPGKLLPGVGNTNAAKHLQRLRAKIDGGSGLFAQMKRSTNNQPAIWRFAPLSGLRIGLVRSGE